MAAGFNLFQMIGQGAGFDSADSLQKALWWYNGTVGSFIAKPPVLSDAEMVQYAAESMMQWIQYVRYAIPLPEGPAVPQSSPLGPVTVPSLFVCGRNELYVKCWGMDGLYEEGGEYCTGDYSYLLVNCGHG